MFLVRRVRARRWLLVVAVIVAVAGGLAVNYEVSASGSPLRERDRPYAVATLRVLIDSDRSSAITNAQASPELLASRAPIYADLAGSDDVRAAASREAGVADGTFPVLPVVASSTSSRSGLTATSSASVEPEADAGPLVVVRNQSTSPLLEFEGHAPTTALATRFTTATAGALSRYVSDRAAREGVRPSSRIVLRELGNPRVGIVENKVPLRTVVVSSVVIFVVLAAFILAVDLLILQARSESRNLRAATRA